MNREISLAKHFGSGVADLFVTTSRAAESDAADRPFAMSGSETPALPHRRVGFTEVHPHRKRQNHGEVRASAQAMSLVEPTW